MTKVLKVINKSIRSLINTVVRIFLYLVYLILFLPFALLVRLFTDYLGIKSKDSSWIPLEKVDNIKESLTGQ